MNIFESHQIEQTAFVVMFMLIRCPRTLEDTCMRIFFVIFYMDLLYNRGNYNIINNIFCSEKRKLKEKEN